MVDLKKNKHKIMEFDSDILTCACLYGNVAQVESVLSTWEKKSSTAVEQCHEMLYLPVCIASYNGNYEIIQTVLKHTSLKVQEIVVENSSVERLPYWQMNNDNAVLAKFRKYDRLTIIDFVVCNDNIEFLKKLVYLYDQYEMKCCYFSACEWGAVKCLDFLININAELLTFHNVKFSLHGHIFTPLMVAAQNSYACTKYILHIQGININEVDNVSNNALHHAVGRVHIRHVSRRSNTSFVYNSYYFANQTQYKVIIVDDYLKLNTTEHDAIKNAENNNETSSQTLNCSNLYYRRIDKETVAIVKLLVSYGCDINQLGTDVLFQKEMSNECLHNILKPFTCIIFQCLLPTEIDEHQNQAQLFPNERNNTLKFNDHQSKTNYLYVENDNVIKLEQNQIESHNLPVENNNTFVLAGDQSKVKSAEDRLFLLAEIFKCLQHIELQSATAWAEYEYPPWTVWDLMTRTCIDNTHSTLSANHINHQTSSSLSTSTITFENACSTLLQELEMSTFCLEQIFKLGFKGKGRNIFNQPTGPMKLDRIMIGLTRIGNLLPPSCGGSSCYVCLTVSDTVLPAIKRYLQEIISLHLAYGIDLFLHIDKILKYENLLLDDSKSHILLDAVLSIFCSLSHEKFYSVTKQIDKTEKTFDSVKAFVTKTQVCVMNLSHNPRPLAHIARVAIYEKMGRCYAPQEVLETFTTSRFLKDYIYTFVY